MANTLANLARMYTETTGTGTLTLLNAVPGFNSFEDEGVPDGSTITYAIYCGPHREIGAGVWTESTKTLTRATVYSSTNGGSRINLTGRSEVFITVAKEDFATFGGGSLADGDYGDIVVSGSGTVLNIDSAVASTFGRSLMDDADAAAARTTLGLGTAAVKNTGTSGNNVPLLDGQNFWSNQNFFGTGTATGATVDIYNDVDFSAPLGLASTQGSANPGPNFLFRRVSSSVAANDLAGQFLFQAYDNTGSTVQSYGALRMRLADIVPATLTGRLEYAGYYSGSYAQRGYWGGGLVVGSPTSGDLGPGTFNAVTLYENGTSLAAKYQGLDAQLTDIAGLTPTDSGVIIGNGSNFVLETGSTLRTSLGIREKLTANRTYYVRTDGSDSNTGLVDNAGGAFLTIQAAINAFFLLDVGGYAVTVQVRDGTYTGQISINGMPPGCTAGNPLIIQGNTTTPANCIIQTTSQHLFVVSSGAEAYIQGFKLQTTTSGTGLQVSDHARVVVASCDFGACATYHMEAKDGAEITITGNYTISGSTVAHQHCTSNGYILYTGGTITITGTPAWGAYYVGANNAYVQYGSTTFSGSATGRRHYIHNNASVYTDGTYDANYFPGSTAGILEGASCIDDFDGTVTLTNLGLQVNDTDESHQLTIKPGSNLSADRVFTLTTGDAARTLDISAADVTVSSFGATLTDDASAQAACATLSTWHVLAASAVQIPHTGTVNETVLATVTIPANSLGPNGIIRVYSNWSNNNDASTKTFRVRLNGLGTQAVLGVSNTTAIGYADQRVIQNRNATNSQVAWQFTSLSGLGQTSGAVTTAAIDTTAATSLVLTGQLADASDTLNLENYMVEICYRA